MSYTVNRQKQFRNMVFFLGGWFVVAAPSAVAEPLISTTVWAANVFDGPSVTLARDLPSTARLNLQASGVVDLYSPLVDPGAPGLRMNAAGVFVADTSGVGGVSTGDIHLPTRPEKPDPDSPTGSLLIGNTTLGFVPVFLANAEAGLGSSEPPVALQTTRRVDELFGTSLDAGTMLHLRVNDINATDNIGKFDVMISVVPEPGSIFLWLIGGIMLFVVGRCRAS